MEAQNERDEIESLLSALYSETEIILWLTSPNKLLDGKIADEMIEDGEADEVRAVVQRMLNLDYI